MGRLLIEIWTWLPPIQRRHRSVFQRFNQDTTRPDKLDDFLLLREEGDLSDREARCDAGARRH